MAEEHSPCSVPPTSLAHLGALIGDPVRAAVLLQLSDGSRRPASELAALSGSSPQALSAHLARLVDGGLVRVEPWGRHRFFSLASGEVAETIEALANWLERPRRIVTHDPQLRSARLCYDHLAGRLGVAVFDRMSTRGFFCFGPDDVDLSEAGLAWCRRVGLAWERSRRSRRPVVRLCSDWTERRHHMGGQFGAALAQHMLSHDLVRAEPRRRSLVLTARGAGFLRDQFGLRAAADGIAEPAAQDRPMKG